MLLLRNGRRTSNETAKRRRYRILASIVLSSVSVHRSWVADQSKIALFSTASRGTYATNHFESIIMDIIGHFARLSTGHRWFCWLFFLSLHIWQCRGHEKRWKNVTDHMTCELIDRWTTMNRKQFEQKRFFAEKGPSSLVGIRRMCAELLESTECNNQRKWDPLGFGWCALS